MSPVSSFLLSPVNFFVTRVSVTAGENWGWMNKSLILMMTVIHNNIPGIETSKLININKFLNIAWIRYIHVGRDPFNQNFPKFLSLLDVAWVNKVLLMLLISIFMRSHVKPKTRVSLYFSLNIGMFILSAVTYASSLRKAVLNFQKPGPLFWFRWLACTTSHTAEWSDSGALIEWTPAKLRRVLSDV